MFGLTLMDGQPGPSLLPIKTYGSRTLSLHFTSNTYQWTFTITDVSRPLLELIFSTHTLCFVACCIYCQRFIELLLHSLLMLYHKITVHYKLLIPVDVYWLRVLATLQGRWL